MSGAVAGRAAAVDENKGRVEATKVRRYWPGKRPDWVEQDEDEDELVPAAPSGCSEDVEEAEAAQRTGETQGGARRRARVQHWACGHPP